MLDILVDELNELGISICPDSKDKAFWMANRWAKRQGQEIILQGKKVYELDKDEAMVCGCQMRAPALRRPSIGLDARGRNFEPVSRS